MADIAGLLQRAGSVGAVIGNGWNRRRAERFGAGFVAHHGLQRAGTNYLLIALKDLGFYPLNALNPRRDHPRHKHFRWQPDKSMIRPGSAFANTVKVETPEALDRAACYPAGTCHLVIQKAPEIWLPSVLNWGLRCKWWPDKSAALADVERVLEDYHAYHRFWYEMQRQAPQRVVILNYETLREEPVRLPEHLEDLSLSISPNARASFTGVYEIIAHSPKGRQNSFNADDRRNLATLAKAWRI